MSSDHIILQHGSSRAEIDTIGAYVRSVALDGAELLKQTHDSVDTHGGMALLIPYANRVKAAKYAWNDREYFLPKNNGKHSIHGLTRSLNWDHKDKKEDKVTMTVRLSEDAYPVPLRVETTYSITDVQFTVCIDAHNEGKISAPFMAGMHPYFLFDREWGIQSNHTFLRLNYEDSFFPDGSITPVEPASLNSSSSLTYDNSYIVGDSLSIWTGNRRVTLNTRSMPFFVVYNGEYAQGRSVAVEPMSGAPDAFNNGIGLITIPSGEHVRCTASFTVSSEAP